MKTTPRTTLTTIVMIVLGDQEDREFLIFDDIVTYVMTQMNESMQRQVGHQMEDLIIDCTYNRYQCVIEK